MSVVDSTSYCSRYIFYLLGISCLFCGVGVLSIAFLVHRLSDQSFSFIDPDLNKSVLIALLTFGLGLLVTAVLGLYGVFRDDERILTLFSVFFITVLVGEIFCCTVVYQQRDKIESTILDRMNNTISVYNTTGYESTTSSWDYLQSKLECCGISKPTEDWKPYIRHHDKLPETCCVIESSQANNANRQDLANGSRYCSENTNTSSRHQNGCFDRIKTFISSYFTSIFWIIVGFALAQVPTYVDRFPTGKLSSYYEQQTK